MISISMRGSRGWAPERWERATGRPWFEDCPSPSLLWPSISAWGRKVLPGAASTERQGTTAPSFSGELVSCIT